MPRHERDLLNHVLIVADRDGREIARVSGDAWFQFAEHLARSYDHHDAASRGETDPWSPEFPRDRDWEMGRQMCALVAMRVAVESVLSGRAEIKRFSEQKGEKFMPAPILKHFEYSHLPPRLRDVSRPFHRLAVSNEAALPDGPEKDMCLRKLLEAKDCAVRAALENGA